MCMSKEEKMSDDNKALVRRLFDEVFSPENLAAADEIMAKDYIEHAVAPFGSDEPGRVHGMSATTFRSGRLLRCPPLVGLRRGCRRSG